MKLLLILTLCLGFVACSPRDRMIRPRSFRSWGYSYALPGSGSYTSVSRGGYNQKSSGNVYNQKSTATKYPGNANPRQYGPISQRIKNYGPYKIQYLQGKSKVIIITLWICNYVRLVRFTTKL